MALGVGQQEQDIKHLIRRARNSPDKSGSLRRETLNRLIELIHSSHTSLKVLAATNIRHFFSDFPDLEEAAINAVYDLCEDHSATVRIEGYDAITQVSRAQGKWVKRNADVLLQLLQSDEPDEVVIVKRALTEHLDMNPQITLGVLCDQIVPPDQPMDEEEVFMRDKLKSLVLTFLAGEAKRAIVERHALPQTPAEDVLVNGLLKGILHLGHADVEMIIKDLLLALPSYSTNSARGQELFKTLLEKARSSLRTDLHKSTPNLADTRFYLDLLALVALDKRIAPPSDLLEFFCTTMIPKMTLQKLSPTDQAQVIIGTATALEVSEKQNIKTEESKFAILQRQVVDACPLLLQTLAHSKTSNEAQGSCRILLRSCLRRKETGWTVPAHLVSAVHEIAGLPEYQAENEQSCEIQNLIRSLVPEAKQATAITTTIPNSVDSMPQTEAPRRKMHPPRKQPELSSTGPSLASTSKRESSSNSTDDSSRPLKKPRLSNQNPLPIAGPSLLSRLGTSLSASAQVGNNNTHINNSKHNSTTNATHTRDRPRTRIDEETTPAGGWSIKGAARSNMSNSSGREEEKEKNTRSRSGSTVQSLLERLESNQREERVGAGNNAAGRRQSYPRDS